LDSNLKPQTSALAYLFPGQGSQYVGMGKSLYEGSAEAKRLFELADDTLGIALTDLCFNGPESELQLTANAQPAILVTSIASLAALREAGKLGEQPAFVAGHSLGEYSALVAAGSLDFADAVRLVRERGRLMQQVGSVGGESSGMAAVIGLDTDKLAQICAAADVDVANFNAPDQTVISGLESNLATAMEAAKAAGAKRVLPLSVSAAFHSRLMREMADDLAHFMQSITVRDAAIPLVNNVNAAPVTDADTIRSGLVAQTYSPVQWVRSLEYMAGQGVSSFIEIGPGKVLAGLVRRTLPAAEAVTSEQLLS
jgi:[acyl-carrier-protein] S-malonyltransferase